MRERSQVLAGPVPVVGPSVPSHLGALVAADVLVRAAAADDAVRVTTAVVTGGLCDQYAAEEDLVREGLDKAVLGREAFAARTQAIDAQGRARLAVTVAALGVGVDLAAAGWAPEEAARAARTAFVRLFEAGLVVEAERVVDVCPRCATVATGADAVPVEVPAESLVLRLAVLEGRLAVGRVDVRCLAPELLPGVVALAVPEGHPAAGCGVAVPVAATVVPAVADPSVDAPVLVVPAHDRAALDLARRTGLGAVAVIDTGGVVRCAGPLDGLGRYAARAAARHLLDAEHAVIAVEPAWEPAARCAACRTVLVPVLGRHWFLAMAELEVAAADTVREGRLLVGPPSAREELLALAGAGDDWCLSRQLWAGQPLPVGRCADCGEPDVSVDPVSSCRRCMGHVVAEDGILDARFVAAVWPLSVSGWPDGGRRTGVAAATTLLVAPEDHLSDVLATAALALRLSGDLPFGEVALTPAAPGAGGVDEERTPLDVAAAVASEGRPTVRAALVLGGPDLATGRDLVASLDAMPPGDADVARLDEACRAALDAATPAVALGLVGAALAEGIPPAGADRVRALARPFLAG